jgi:hypothetical protein
VGDLAPAAWSDITDEVEKAPEAANARRVIESKDRADYVIAR